MLLLSAVLGATVLREPIASAASPFQNVIIGNTASQPVPVQQQGTAHVTVDNTAVETQVLLDQEFTGDGRVTIPVAGYKTFHVDFKLRDGGCAGSGASLDIFEGTDFARRGFISADDACAGSFLGQQLELAAKSLTFVVDAPAGDTWRVVVFGRAN